MPRLLRALPLLLLLCTAGAAMAGDALSSQQQLLNKEQEAVNRLHAGTAELREQQRTRLAELTTHEVTPVMLEQAKLDLEEARVRLESVRVDLQAVRHQREEIAAAIRDLENQLQQLKLPAKGGSDARQPAGRLEELGDVLAEKRASALFEERRTALRESAVEAAQERLALARQWHESLSELYRTAVAESKQVALDDLKQRMEQEQRAWLARAAEWRRELQGLDPADSRKAALLQARTNDAEERARLALQQIRFAQIGAHLDVLATQPVDADSEPDQLKAALEQVLSMRSELESSVGLLAKRRDVLVQQREVVAKRRAAGDPAASREELGLYDELQTVLTQHLHRAERLVDRIGDLPAQLRLAYEQSFRRGLTARRALPDDMAGWAVLRDELLSLPSLLTRAVTEAAHDLVRPLGTFAPDRWLLLVLSLAGCIGFSAILGRSLARNQGDAGRFVTELVAVPVELARRSARPLALLGSLAILTAFSQPNAPSSTLLLTLLLVGAGATLLINLAWTLLISPRTPHKRQHPRLYGQLKWLIGAVAALGFITATAHVLALSTGVVNLLDRLFMLSLLLFTVPVLETRRLGLAALAERFGERYWTRVARLLSLLAPVAVIATASVGVGGYVNLARAIGGALALVLGVLAAWLVLGRLLREGTDGLKNLANENTGYGMLWAKGVIEPLYAVARPVLFIGLWAIPFKVYGIGLATPPIADLVAWLSRPLFSIGSNAINPAGLLMALVGLVAVVRIGRWLRLMTYRWAYSGVTDEGIRHSLSVFTQYAFVLVGVLLTVHLIGIDLTTLAIFAGALGVGIGFGLQNIANNFISGLLLLAERPLRTSDIVRVGEHEGEVTHIGMRSITVKTWDNQEVIMPNADVISNAFINWTHNDHIVRTVLAIRVGFDSDPRQAKAIIERVLAAHDELLSDPEPRVYLKEFGESAQHFHVQYFTDLKRSNRLEVRSDLLMTIWQELRAAGIRIPRPQLEVRMRGDGEIEVESSPLPVSLVG